MLVDPGGREGRAMAAEAEEATTTGLRSLVEAGVGVGVVVMGISGESAMEGLAHTTDQQTLQ